MRIAIIDLGTNSVRFDVHQIHTDGRSKQLFREKMMVRLGQGVFLKGKLDREAAKRTIEAIESFSKKADSLGVDRIVAFATSALREAVDRDRFVAEVRKKTGIELRIISGEEEALLISRGVLGNEKNLTGRFALVDIGGGSTEISICKNKEILHSESFAAGTARLTQMFLRKNPPPERDIEALRKYIKSVIEPKIEAEEWPGVPLVIGSSGTIRALTKIATGKEDAKSLSRADLRSLVKKMSKLSITDLMELPGMEARRVDMILSGAILLESCLGILGAKKVRMTSFSLRDGILAEERQLFREHQKSHLQFHLPDLVDKAAKLGADHARALQGVTLAGAIFDGTKRLHGLGKEWKIYLQTAMAFRNVGHIISTSKHEEHSAYIVRSLDLFSIEPWETELVAELCRQHNGTKDTYYEPDVGAKKVRDAFPKLLALLRIADALNSGTTNVKIRMVKISKKECRFFVGGKGAGSLEVMRVEQRQPMFIGMFGKKPVVQIGPQGR